MPPVLSTPGAVSMSPSNLSRRGASPFENTQADSAFGDELSDASDSDTGLAFDRVRIATKDDQPLVSFIDFSRVFTGYARPDKLVHQIKTQPGIKFLFMRPPGANKETPMVQVNQLIDLIKVLPGEQAEKLRNDPQTYQILKEWLQVAFDGYDIETILGPIPESASNADDVIQFTDLGVDDFFKGKSIRRTRESHPRIAVLDALGTIGDYTDVNQKWALLKKQYGNFGAEMWKFPGKECNPTPVITVPKMIELINVLNSPAAIIFRQQGAKALVRYLGGDETLIQEVRAINNAQQTMPEDHPMRVFGEHFEATNGLKRRRDDDDNDGEELAAFKERYECRRMELELLEKEERVKREQIITKREETLTEIMTKREETLTEIMTKREETLTEIMTKREETLTEVMTKKAELELQEVQRVANLVTDGPSNKKRVLISDVFNDITQEWPTQAFKMKFGRHLAKIYREAKGQNPEKSRDYYGKLGASYAYYDYDFVFEHMLDFLNDEKNKHVCMPIKDV